MVHTDCYASVGRLQLGCIGSSASGYKSQVQPCPLAQCLFPSGTTGLAGTRSSDYDRDTREQAQVKPPLVLDLEISHWPNDFLDEPKVKRQKEKPTIRVRGCEVAYRKGRRIGVSDSAPRPPPTVGILNGNQLLFCFLEVLIEPYIFCKNLYLLGQKKSEEKNHRLVLFILYAFSF